MDFCLFTCGFLFIHVWIFVYSRVDFVYSRMDFVYLRVDTSVFTCGYQCSHVWIPVYGCQFIHAYVNMTLSLNHSI
jgi:hypothetical protein